jgi:hypothetical protein
MFMRPIGFRYIYGNLVFSEHLQSGNDALLCRLLMLYVPRISSLPCSDSELTYGTVDRPTQDSKGKDKVVPVLKEVRWHEDESTVSVSTMP